MDSLSYRAHLRQRKEFESRSANSKGSLTNCEMSEVEKKTEERIGKGLDKKTVGTEELDYDESDDELWAPRVRLE